MAGDVVPQLVAGQKQDGILARPNPVESPMRGLAESVVSARCICPGRRSQLIRTSVAAAAVAGSLHLHLHRQTRRSQATKLHPHLTPRPCSCQREKPANLTISKAATLVTARPRQRSHPISLSRHSLRRPSPSLSVPLRPSPSLSVPLPSCPSCFVLFAALRAFVFQTPARHRAPTPSPPAAISASRLLGSPRPRLTPGVVQRDNSPCPVIRSRGIVRRGRHRP